MDKAKGNPWVECWDSPWFGIGAGVVIGAFGSLLSVRWLAGIGWFAMSLQIFRYDFLRRGVFARVVFGLILSCSLGLALLAIWKHLPLPPEPITRKDITEIVGDAFKSSASPTSSGTPVPMQSPSTRNERLLTKNDIEKAVKDAVAELTKSNPSNMIGPRTVSAQSDSSSTPPRYLQPAIRSVPPNFSDGQITGEHFGTTVLDVKLHLRVRQSAEDGNYRVGGRVNPGALLGDLGPSNYISLSGNIIKQWSDTNIELKFPADYWSGLWAFVDSKAKGRQIPPPSRSDVQVCYQIRLGDAQNSNELCGQ
jgi:hypothetical protein